MNDHDSIISIVMHIIIVWALNFVAFLVAVMPVLQALVLVCTLIYTIIQARIAWHNWKRREKG